MGNYLKRLKEAVTGKPKQISEETGVGSAGDLFRKTEKTNVPAGSYNPAQRKRYEKMLEEAGK